MVGRLLGCGIDAEDSRRFTKLVGENHPWPLVFSRREVDHSRSLPDPAWALCASFCAKEALCKAVQTPFDLALCELLATPGQAAHLHLAEELRNQFDITSATVELSAPAPDEVLAVVCVFGPEDAHLPDGSTG